MTVLYIQEAEAVEAALEIAYGDDPYQLEEEEVEEEADIDYKPIVYNGIPGIFIPVQSNAAANRVSKRQYLSLVPGMRKRTAWYPGDTSASRWGAITPPEDKRTADEYERLYRLARALSRKK